MAKRRPVHSRGVEPPGRRIERVPAVVRTFAVLEQLARAAQQPAPAAGDSRGTGAGASELAAVLGTHRNGVLRILETLRDLGYVDYDPGRDQYRLEPRLYYLGLAATRVDLAGVARPYMTQLRDALLESVELAAPDGDSFQLLDAVSCLGSIYLVARPGMRLGYAHFAPGWVLLAGQSEATVARLHAAGALQAEVGDHPVLPLGRLQAELAQIRAAGIDRRRQSRRPEVERVAAPIFDSQGAVVGALGVAGLHSRLQAQADTEQQVKAVAAAISRRLGWGSPPVPPVA